MHKRGASEVPRTRLRACKISKFPGDMSLPPITIYIMGSTLGICLGLPQSSRWPCQAVHRRMVWLWDYNHYCYIPLWMMLMGSEVKAYYSPTRHNKYMLIIIIPLFMVALSLTLTLVLCSSTPISKPKRQRNNDHYIQLICKALEMYQKFNSALLVLSSCVQMFPQASPSEVYQ